MLAVFALATQTPHVLAGKLIHHIHLDSEQVSVTTVDAHSVLSVEGYLTLTDPGQPQLPYRVVNLLLPQGQTVGDFRVSTSGDRELARGLNFSVAPDHESVDGVKGVGPATAPDGDAFPGAPVRFLGTGTWHGYRIASFAVFPLRIRDGSLRITSTTTLEITTIPDSDPPVIRKRYRTGFRDTAMAEINRMVDNPQLSQGYQFSEVKVDVGRGGFQPTTFPSLEGSPVDYVIITIPELVASYQVLADWKTEKGVPTVVRTTDWIQANYRNGSDLAETIRTFIADAYTKWGTSYVLLGGDTEQIPARMCWSGFYDGGRSLPVDMYFGALDGDWNADGDNIFGEALVDAPDLFPEVYTGRLPTSTVADADVMINKILTYETPNDLAYTNKVLMLGEVLFPQNWQSGQTVTLNGADHCELVRIKHMLDPGLDVVRKYQTENLFFGSLPETEACVIDSINAGFNHINHVGHGFRFTMSVGEGEVNNADADAFTNGDRLSNLYLLNCTAVAFTYYCLAEHYLRNASGGAVSVVGSNESAFPNGASYYMDDYYGHVFGGGNVSVGEAFAVSRLNRTPLALFGDNIDFWTHYIYSLLGDPEMPLWTDTVAPLSVTHVNSVGLGSSNITVTVMDGGSPADSVRVCLSKGEDDYQIGMTDVAGQVTLAFRAESSGQIKVVVTGTNYARNSGVITVDSTGGAYVHYNGSTAVDDNSGSSSGNGDGVVDSGEIVEFTLSVKNDGDTASGLVDVVLRSNDGNITIEDSTAAIGVVGAGANANATDPVRVAFSSSLADESVVAFTLVVKEGGVETWSDTFNMLVHSPLLSTVSIRIDDSGGNNDGIVDAGEPFRLHYRIKNFGTGATTSLSADLVDLDGAFVFTDSTDTYNQIDALQDAENVTGFLIEETTVATEHLLEITITDGYGRSMIDTMELRYPIPPGSLFVDPRFGVDRLQVSWAASVSADVDAYNVYVAPTPGGPYVLVNVDPVFHTVVLNDNLAPSTFYYYVVTTLDDSGNESAFSAEAAGSTNPAQMSGWPILMGSETSSSPSIGDIDGDGDLEIVQGNDLIYAWHHDGQEMLDGDGDAQTWGVLSSVGDAFVGHIALGRIDGKPGLDIVAASRNTKEVFVLNYAGDLLPGWPQSVENFIRAGTAIGDIDGDGVLEIIAVDEGGVVYAWNHDGSEYIDGDSNPMTPGVFFRMPGCVFNYSSPAIADIDNDGKEEIVLGSEGNEIYVFEEDGSVAAGWPYPLVTDVSGSIAIGDVDNDGDMEIVAFEKGGGIHVINHDGSLLFFQFVNNNGAYFSPSPALGDVDNNGTLELFVPSANGLLYGFTSTGGTLSGWPVQYSANTYTESSPIIADMNGDGFPDVVLGDEAQFLNAWDASGNVIAGFPLATGDAMRGVPAIADLDNDGDGELVASGWDKTVYVWDFTASFDENDAPWSSFHGNTHNSGLVGAKIPTGVGGATVSVMVRGGAVELTFRLPAEAGALFDLERSELNDGRPGSFASISQNLAVNLDGMVRYVDYSAKMGSHYVYRLSSREIENVSFTSQPVYIPVTRAELNQNYPNPFNPVTTIEYLVPDGIATHVVLAIYDVRGARVRTLISGQQSGGRHVASWDGQNDLGNPVGSGVYFYRLSVSTGFSATRKMLLLK